MVACVPTLGPCFAIFESKMKTLKFRHQHAPITNGPSRVPTNKMPPPSIVLGSLNVDRGPFVQSSAEAAQRSYAEYHYGHDVSNISLVPGIQKTTTVEVEVERGLGYV